MAAAPEASPRELLGRGLTDGERGLHSFGHARGQAKARDQGGLEDETRRYQQEARGVAF